MKIKTLIALFAAVAFVGTTTGCGEEKKADDKKEAKKDDDKKDEKDEKDGDTKEAKSDADIPKVCQEYMDTWKKCSGELPDASKEAMEKGFKTFEESLEKAKGNAELLKGLEASCKASLDGLKAMPQCK